jgi:hypothetical protein
MQPKLHKNFNPNRGSCCTYARIQYSKLTFLALFAVKARRQKWKYNFGLILPVRSGFMAASFSRHSGTPLTTPPDKRLTTTRK